MIIILDTNIIRQDLFFESGKSAIFLDYIEKTDASIMLPEIVLLEIESVYRRVLEEKFEKYKNSVESLRRIMTNTMINIKNIDIDKEVDNYMEYLLHELHLEKGDLLSYKNDYLPTIIEKSVNRIRPFNNKGEEFRDALIWQSILDLAKEEKNETIVFISTNTTDFADSDNNLHSDLVNELNEFNLTLVYHSSLENFLKEYASSIENISIEWLRDYVNEYSFKHRIINLLEKSKQLQNWLNKQDDYFNTIIKLSPSDFQIYDFFVYKMSNNSVRIEVVIVFNLLIKYSDWKQMVKTIDQSFTFYIHLNFVDQNDVKTEISYYQIH